MGAEHYAKREISLAQQSICDPDEDRLTLHIDELPLLAAGDRAEGGGNYSAYLWSMFVICREDFEPLFNEQTWRGVLPFFEHANVAEEQTMATLRAPVGDQDADHRAGVVARVAAPSLALRLRDRRVVLRLDVAVRRRPTARCAR